MVKLDIVDGTVNVTKCIGIAYSVASPGNKVRGHNMNFFSPPLPVFF